MCGIWNASQKIDSAALKELSNQSWTGNIRELRNVVERLIILSKETITKKDVEQYVVPSGTQGSSLDILIDQFDNLQALQSYIAEKYDTVKSTVV